MMGGDVARIEIDPGKHGFRPLVGGGLCLNAGVLGAFVIVKRGESLRWFAQLPQLAVHETVGFTEIPGI